MKGHPIPAAGLVVGDFIVASDQETLIPIVKREIVNDPHSFGAQKIQFEFASGGSALLYPTTCMQAVRADA